MKGKKNAKPIDKQYSPSTLLAALVLLSHTNKKNNNKP
jgi:hypothetical protein